MPTATVAGAEVPWESICTHWNGWNKVSGPVRPYRLAVSPEYVIANFNEYWSDFVGTEAQDDGFPPQGIYAELAAAGHPSLEVMLSVHPGLFSRLVLEGLQTEFIGFMVSMWTPVQLPSPTYFLRSLTAVDVSSEQVIIEGGCCEM